MVSLSSVSYWRHLLNSFLLTTMLLVLATSAVAGQGRAATYQHDGQDRTYLLYSPDAIARSAKQLPLVLVLHGGGGRPSQVEWATHGRFNDLADKYRFIVIYPGGIGRGWNDGRGDQIAFPGRERVDDIGFLHALIDHVANHRPVDTKHLYVTGISNGGMMALRLACESGRFRAVATVVANLPENLERVCNPRGVSTLLINGSDDNLVPFDGGFVNGIRKTNERGRVLSAVATFELFGRANQCTDLTDQPLHDRFNDQTSVSRHEYHGCSNGVQIVQYRINGGGHAWPGARTRLPKFLIGNSSREIDATQEIWRFFGNQR